MSLKKINKKIMDKQNKIQFSVQNAMMNPNSPLFCANCKKRLGIITMVHFAMGKKKGEPYKIVCKHCNHKNIRIKGDIGKKFDSDWEKYGV